MSRNRYSYIEKINLDKPTKRVRFSEEIKDVYKYECDEGQSSRIFSLENESGTLSSELKYFDQDEFPINESMNAMRFGNAVHTADTDQCMYECDEKIDELTECNKRMTISDNPREAESYPQHTESCSGSDLNYFNNNNSDMADLNVLIRETEHMTISVPDRVQEAKQHFLSETLEMYPSCSPSSEENVLQAVAQPIEHKSSIEACSKSFGGMLIDGQTSKLNSFLKMEDDKVDSAVDLKNTVFNAWNKFKTESAKVVCTAEVHEPKEKFVTQPKPSPTTFKCIKDVSLPKPSPKTFEYVKDLKTSRNIIKIGVKKVEVDPSFQGPDEDIEEYDKPFTNWKNNHDKIADEESKRKRYEEKKKRRCDALSEQFRKGKAETAFLSWY